MLGADPWRLTLPVYGGFQSGLQCGHSRDARWPAVAVRRARQAGIQYTNLDTRFRGCDMRSSINLEIALARWQREPDCRALSRLALGTDRSTVRFH
jgi:hypothetical protein